MQCRHRLAVSLKGITSLGLPGRTRWITSVEAGVFKRANLSIMKKIIQYFIFLILAGNVISLSCKKEKSCESCLEKNKNKPPIPNAGSDKIITLPTDSVLLDGSSSSDPDGMISSYLWTKISGPASSSITRPSDSITKVKALVAGTYQFELKVIDNGGLSTKDTMNVLVDAVPMSNHPPIANTGADQTIALPATSVKLDGSGSTDPDSNIVSYTWTKISGPSSFAIVNTNTMQTQVNNLVEGKYQFELKVTDAGGLFSKDTLQVVVNASPAPFSVCDPISRPIVNAQLIPVGTLSEARTRIAVASAGNKIVFAGGLTSSGQPSATVDIYDVNSQTWSIAQLTIPRHGIAAIAAGNNLYFAGGRSQSIDTPSSRIDIYNVVSNTWSTAQLSEARSEAEAAVVGNKVMFAGGIRLYTCSSCFSNKVDIYDVFAGTWTIANLSVARQGLSATTAGNRVYFAGGNDWFVGTGVYDQIDVYDNGNNSWSTERLIERKAHHGSIAIGDYIYWAGGETWNNINDYETTCTVEERNTLDGASAVTRLFQPSYANSNSQPGMKCLLKNGSIVFYTGSNKFDIYEPVSGVWSIGTMNQGFDFAAVISVNNIIYIAGGGFPYHTPSSNQVLRLEF